MKTASVIGIGRLGVCLCLTLERAGYRVVGCDVREDRVRSVNDKTLRSTEPGVEAQLGRSAHLVATTDLAAAVDHSDLVFVTVRTTSESDGRYDVAQVDAVVDSLVEIGPQRARKSLVISCNVNPEYSDAVQARLTTLNYVVSYNPEWVRQGSILADQSAPDTVVIGAPSDEECARIEAVYADICSNEPSIHRMSRLAAEITKVSLNCALTNKIALANAIGDMATARNQDPAVILAAIGSDSRIGRRFFEYGFGYGGPCFPRDTRAFIHYADKCGIDASIVRGVVTSNQKHLEFQVERYCEKNAKPAVVVIDEVTYKPGSPIIEEAQQLQFAVELARRGYDVVIRESAAVVDHVEAIYGDLFSYERR